MLAKYKTNPPTDPLHPFYYHIYASTLPPESAYRLVPMHHKNRVSKSVEESKSRAFMPQRRYLYQGWDNWTDIEKQWIADVKQLMLEEKGIDLTR